MQAKNFPSFSEGLSLRLMGYLLAHEFRGLFPFLFGGTFIEADEARSRHHRADAFPFLFGGTFIEAFAICGRS